MTGVSNNIEFWMRPVRPSEDAKFLFDLLKERDSRANISHKKMPTYSSHVRFIESKPYKKWYIVYFVEFLSKSKLPKYNKTKVGSVYLSKNDEIGIFVLKKFQGKNIGKFALQELIKRNPKKRYLANVSPNNKNSMKFFQNNNFKLIQYTFQLDVS
jgi:RimJ/RimL family protein N-acetyltransferase